MADTGFDLVDWDDLEALEQKELTERFADRVFPILTPLAVGPGHPFPYISTLSLNLGLLTSSFTIPTTRSTKRCWHSSMRRPTTPMCKRPRWRVPHIGRRQDRPSTGTGGLLRAPSDMRHRLEELIANEAAHGADGHIRINMNSLVDPEIIAALYVASQAGARIELIVRGMCCLRPGINGVSETITVRSVLGRDLEHARIYWFANGDSTGHPHYLIGSADVMGRNLDRRVEALVPVDDPVCTDRLNTITAANLADDRRSWSLRGDGSWSAPSPTGQKEMHVFLHSGRASA